MVDDCKLKTANNGLDSEKAYGSKVDNENALKSLAAIKTTGDQSTESFASMIVKNFGKQSKVNFTLLFMLLRLCLMSRIRGQDMINLSYLMFGAKLGHDIVEGLNPPRRWDYYTLCGWAKTL